MGESRPSRRERGTGLCKWRREWGFGYLLFLRGALWDLREVEISGRWKEARKGAFRGSETKRVRLFVRPKERAGLLLGLSCREVKIVVTCQSQGNHTQQHSLLYHVF